MIEVVKRLLTVVILSLCFLGLSQQASLAENVVYFSIDLGGQHELSIAGISSNDDVDTGFSFGYEYITDQGSQADFGFGYELQLPRKLSDYEGDFYFYNFYAVLNVPFAGGQTMEPYFIGRVGYNFFFGDNDYCDLGSDYADLSGGIYYAVGIGFKSQANLRVQLLYSVNNGSGEGDLYVPGYGAFYDLSGDITYTKLNLSLGYSW